jgi:hypothetical protein
MKPQYILIHGNPVDGFAYVGPFDTASDAHNHGEHMGYPEYWLTVLVSEKEDKEE